MIRLIIDVPLPRAASKPLISCKSKQFNTSRSKLLMPVDLEYSSPQEQMGSIRCVIAFSIWCFRRDAIGLTQYKLSGTASLIQVAELADHDVKLLANIQSLVGTYPLDLPYLHLLLTLVLHIALVAHGASSGRKMPFGSFFTERSPWRHDRRINLQACGQQ